jgi:PTS system galactitol-specific IIC component
MMPVALVLAFVLPGIKFIPLGDLVSLVGGIALICAATRGNVVRSFLIGLPIIVVHLYTASFMADSYTKLAAAVNYKLADYTGIFTSFVDGGNILRTWAVKLFSGNTAALILAPIVLLALYFTYRIIRSESK